MNNDNDKKTRSVSVNMKKRLFVSGAMLVVSAILLIFVSFGAYRITIEGEADFMKAADIKASINLSPTIDEHSAAIEGFLRDLQPGDDAKTYASNPTGIENGIASEARKFTLSVTNGYSTSTDAYDKNAYPGGNNKPTAPSQVPIRYNVIVETGNFIPIEMLMIDEDGQKYLSKRSDDGTYRFYKMNGNGSVESEEMVFSFKKQLEDPTLMSGVEIQMALDQLKTHNYKIYVGWDNSFNSVSQYHKNVDASARKEVELFNVKVNVLNEPAGIEVHSPESWYTSRIPHPVN